MSARTVASVERTTIARRDVVCVRAPCPHPAAGVAPVALAPDDPLSALVLHVRDEIAPSVMRALKGRTLRDGEVDSLASPSGPMWLRVSVAALRWYRAIRPPSVGQRCVWDPSCSRYAELALRNRGLLRGLAAILGRLTRCRPERGGIDLP